MAYAAAAEDSRKMTGGPMSEAVILGCVRMTKSAMTRLRATGTICVLR